MEAPPKSNGERDILGKHRQATYLRLPVIGGR
jgi:hypothetical protein